MLEKELRHSALHNIALLAFKVAHLSRLCSGNHCLRMNFTIFQDVPMTNIGKEPRGGWMILLFMVMSFVVECVNGMCQSFLSGCVFSLFFSFFNPRFWPSRSGFFTFPCLWEIGFSSQMIVELSVGYFS